MNEFDFSTTDSLAKLVIGQMAGDTDPESRVFLVSGEGKLPPDELAINGNKPTMMQEGSITHKQRGDQGRFEIVARDDNGGDKERWIIIIGTRYGVTLNGEPLKTNGEKSFEIAGRGREIFKQRVQDSLYTPTPTPEKPKFSWLAAAQNFGRQAREKLSPYTQRVRPAYRGIVNLITLGHL